MAKSSLYVLCCVYLCCQLSHKENFTYLVTQVEWQNNSKAKEHRRHLVRQKGKCYKSNFRFLVVCAFSLTNKLKTHQIGINYITTYYTITAIWLLLLTSSLTGAGSPTVDVNDRIIAIGVGINKLKKIDEKILIPLSWKSLSEGRLIGAGWLKEAKQNRLKGSLWRWRGKGLEITISNFSMLVGFHLFVSLTSGALGCLNQTALWDWNTEATGRGDGACQALAQQQKEVSTAILVVSREWRLSCSDNRVFNIYTHRKHMWLKIKHHFVTDVHLKKREN